MTQAIEHAPSKQKALNINPSIEGGESWVVSYKNFFYVCIERETCTQIYKIAIKFSITVYTLLHNPLPHFINIFL
jgi:hypothetical protein